MSDSKYIAGMVVIPRRGWRPTAGDPTPPRGRRPQHGWTLHYTDCPYALRSDTAMPAPAKPYPNTSSCSNCKSGKGDHRVTIVEMPDGNHEATCAVCPDKKWVAATHNAARLRAQRYHDALRRVAEAEQGRR